MRAAGTAGFWAHGEAAQVRDAHRCVRCTGPRLTKVARGIRYNQESQLRTRSQCRDASRGSGPLLSPILRSTWTRGIFPESAPGNGRTWPIASVTEQTASVERLPAPLPGHSRRLRWAFGCCLWKRDSAQSRCAGRRLVPTRPLPPPPSAHCARLLPSGNTLHTALAHLYASSNTQFGGHRPRPF